MMREKQDLPAGRTREAAERSMGIARARVAPGHARTPAPGRARLRVCPCVAVVWPRCVGLHAGVAAGAHTTQHAAAMHLALLASLGRSGLSEHMRLETF